ncbi:MAG: 2Fe-2S iron-sulfur cluster-binding protein, partial [Syntrophobacteraceae bacterium]
MSKIIVTFTPEGTRTEASPGEKLINIASYADIDISNMCGGLGVCGKCRVKVNKGKVNLSSRVISMLSRKELEQGYVFACQAESQDEDLEIWIPSASRRELHQIQVADYLVAYDQPTQVEGTPDLPTIRCSCPLCRKYYLDLPYPTVHDSISDPDRVYRELKKLPELTNIKARSSVLAGLGDLVRKSNWKVTATVHFGDSDCPCISYLEPGDTTSANFGVAIDVGTTTIVAQLMNLATGKSAGVQASHNSQARYGEDVISRMVYACSHDGLTPLTEAVVHTINSLIQSLVLKSGITHDQITCFVAAGNTVMSHLLLGLNPANIRNEPYIP